jgi:Tol biopolymer transport system component
MNDEGAIPKNHLYSSVHDNFYLEYQSLSPDSTRLLGVDFHAGQNVVYKDLASGKFVNVTNFDWKSEGHGWTYSPVWSRDGRRIAFRFGGWENPIEELRITDLNGDSRTIYRCEVKEETIYPVDWFPGESTILAIHTDKDKAIRLGTIPVQGGDFNLLYAIAPHKGANFRAGAGDIVRPDLSPNGKFIAFHELKDGATDIFILDIAKKTVKPIMDSPANNEQPSWSPDGKYIAFMSDRSGTRTIWAVAMNEDGTANGEPFLIRPGQSITLKDWTTQGLCYEEWISMVDIFIMPVDPASGAPCGKPRQLDFRPTGRNSFPRWSPDGKHLAFVANPTGAAGDFQIVVYPLSEGEARTYKAPSPRIGGVDPPALLDLCWLPDSSGISYSALVPKESSNIEEFSRKLFLLKIDTGEWQEYSLNLKTHNYSFTAWRKDGQGFCYTINTRNSDTDAIGIVERDLSTGKEHYVYRLENPAGGMGGFPNLRFSPDFSKLAFHQWYKGRNIHVIDLDSGEKLYEFKWSGFPTTPSWSPDGKHLMMPRFQQDYKLHVFSTIDGSSMTYDVDTEVSPNAGIAQLDWSPDGNRIAFAKTYQSFDTYLLRDVIPDSKR